MVKATSQTERKSVSTVRQREFRETGNEPSKPLERMAAHTLSALSNDRVRRVVKSLVEARNSPPFAPMLRASLAFDILAASSESRKRERQRKKSCAAKILGTPIAWSPVVMSRNPVVANKRSAAAAVKAKRVIIEAKDIQPPETGKLPTVSATSLSMNGLAMAMANAKRETTAIFLAKYLKGVSLATRRNRGNEKNGIKRVISRRLKDATSTEKVNTSMILQRGSRR
jgi:hypothetical protein